jgi:hypothetical protein
MVDIGSEWVELGIACFVVLGFGYKGSPISLTRQDEGVRINIILMYGLPDVKESIDVPVRRSQDCLVGLVRNLRVVCTTLAGFPLLLFEDIHGARRLDRKQTQVHWPYGLLCLLCPQCCCELHCECLPNYPSFLYLVPSRRLDRL